jgi:hypothetical protein
MRSFYSLLLYRKPCLGPDKKLHTPVGVLPSGLLTSLRLLVRGLLPATTRRAGGGGEKKKGEKEEGVKKGGREKEREREKREGSGTDIILLITQTPYPQGFGWRGSHPALARCRLLFIEKVLRGREGFQPEGFHLSKKRNHYMGL